jgi:hypothetical protein
VYVYRDDSEPAPGPSPSARSEDDAAYWYDLLADDPVPERPEARGPFEPLQHSSGRSDAASTPAAGTEQAPGPASDERADTPENAQARSLEQLKDLYRTAEAIGEQNVDKHFDLLLAQQRMLISEYFGRFGTPSPTVAGPRDGEAEPWRAGGEEPSRAGGEEPSRRGGEAEVRQRDGEVTPPEGVAVWAEPPRA